MKTIFVIFWATWDLAKRKLFPWLSNIYKEQWNNLQVLAVWRRDLDNKWFHDLIKEEIKPFIDKNEKPSDFIDSIIYSKVEINKENDYKSLQKDIIKAKYWKDSQVIFYLSVSPEYFWSFVDNYKNIALNWAKVIFEKPFWVDLESARLLNEKIMEVFEEKQVYRIDHYVWKEAIQNILSFRFSNTIFEPLWNNKYIDNIQITASESIWVEDRWWYYDKSGALRDMVQNHLFQVLSLVVMNKPKNIDASWIREEKLKVFESLKLWNNFEENVVFAQYKWYKDEKWVERESKTETFAAVKLEMDKWDFAWVPIYLRTWKKMSKKSTNIVIEFKEINDISLKKYWKTEKNRIVLEIQPNEAIDIQFNIKENWKSDKIKKVSSNFLNEMDSKEAYEKLMEDIIESDKTLFTSWRMLEESWKIVEELINCKNNCPILHEYDSTYNWPKESFTLLEKDWNKWYE